VGAVVLVREGDARAVDPSSTLRAPAGVVLVRRRFPPLAGEWSLPGGAVEIGETLAEAVVREVAEETGLAVEVGPLVEVFDRIERDGNGRVEYHYILVDYLCRPRGGRLCAGSDVSEVVLADPRALESYGLTVKAAAVIAAALQLAAVRG
jgi:ADP-ribose pyrophosphatase YjhB (NUDIX family)